MKIREHHLSSDDIITWLSKLFDDLDPHNAVLSEDAVMEARAYVSHARECIRELEHEVAASAEAFAARDIERHNRIRELEQQLASCEKRFWELSVRETELEQEKWKLEQENAKLREEVDRIRTGRLGVSLYEYEKVQEENAKLCAELEAQRTSKRGQPPEEG